MVKKGGDAKTDETHLNIDKDRGTSATSDGHGHGGNVKHPLPHGQHEIPPYAFKGAWQADKRGNQFWHPVPKDLPEAPVHFNQNAVNLEMYLGDPRQRLAGMTDAERAWRKQFLRDQHLSPEEPVYLPEFQGNVNPIRRIYRLPWDTLEKRVLIPAFGYNWGHHTRMVVPKLILGAIVFMWGHYHLKYHHPTWWDPKRVWVMRPDIPLMAEKEIREKEPGLIEKGFRHHTKKQDYHDLDFKHRYTHLQLDPPVRP